MKQYVQYHNTRKQGPLAAVGAPFTIFAKKPIQHLRGRRVWLISSDGTSSPKAYYLRYVFSVEDVFSDGLKNVARGNSGKLFHPPIPLNTLPWFREFIAAQQNFSLGVREIQDEFLPRFLALEQG